MNLSSHSPNLWTERYETLRRHFLEDRQLLASDPPALIRLLRNGVADWMSRWSTETLSKPTVAAAQPWRPCASLWPEQLTMLLAHITLQHLQPALKL